MMYRRKLTESEEMKQQTVANIIEASAKEGLVTELHREGRTCAGAAVRGFVPGG